LAPLSYNGFGSYANRGRASSARCPIDTDYLKHRELTPNTQSQPVAKFITERTYYLPNTHDLPIDFIRPNAPTTHSTAHESQIDTMTATTLDRGRITARVPQNVQDTLQQAADLLGATLNQFVVQAALTEAQRVIERERVIHLSSNDAAFLLNLLETPPAPNARLRKALQNYKSRTLDADHSTFKWASQPKPVPKRKR
jgi:uncharacterized protein (DUF1778 family)